MPSSLWVKTRLGALATFAAVVLPLNALATRTPGQATFRSLLPNGIRGVVANLAWLRAYVAWERQDVAAVSAWLRFAVAVDDRALALWLNGARILAYDVPEWRIQAAGGYEAVPSEVVRRWREEQAEVALQHLARARSVHDQRAELWIEEGNLHLHRRGDLEAAAEAYRLAAREAGAPYHAARLHAELLRRLGRPADALGVLVAEYPRLAKTAGREREWALPEIVQARIQELERELGLPSGEGAASAGAR